MFYKTIFLGVLLLYSLLVPVEAKAGADCSNRYLTIVNPVRGRDLWIDKSIEPLKDQYRIVSKYNFPATWLLQDDVLGDRELINEIKSFENIQEKGVFLEVSKKLAEKSGVVYPYDSPWFSPRAVFLSGYTQSERRRLIDVLFNEFKHEFGYFPKSVGAWWIDSYSLDYLKKKYDITGAIIVADQKTTDNYGIWGQWWGVPYYPAKANILVPASDLRNKQRVVIIQWAQRDPSLANGIGPLYSNHSLQANDYTSLGYDTNYFRNLVNIYLDCQNNVGQITVGLETGIESVKSFGEYENQMEVLGKIENLNIVTMSQFAQKFAEIYPDIPRGAVIEDSNSQWILTPVSRSNEKLGERVEYDTRISFSDYFIPDQDSFLDRNLSGIEKINPGENFFPWYLIIISILLGLSYFKRILSVWGIALIFSFLAFGLVLRSFSTFGWDIYFGPKVTNIMIIQSLVMLVVFIFVYLVRFMDGRLYYFLPISYIFDLLLYFGRFSFISEKYYLGFSFEPLKFIGVTVTKNYNFEFVYINLPSYLYAGLIKFPFDKVWQNLWIYFLVFPLLHIIISLILGFLFLKLPYKLRFTATVIIALLLLEYLNIIFQADPVSVTMYG